MAVESFVTVAPDSSGKSIRNIQADVLQPDGTTKTVQMQCTTIVDENGTPLGLYKEIPVSDQEVKELLLVVIDRLNKLLEQ